MADEQRTDDLQRARREAAELLGLDVERLCPADGLRVDLVCTLRLAIDDASASLIDGNSTDLARLISATESLIRLMPKHELPQHRRDDPRQRMWEIYSQMRERGELFERAQEPSLRRRIAELEAEVEQLRAGATVANAAVAEPLAPPDPNVLRLSRPEPVPPQPCSAEESRRRMDVVNQPVPQHVRDTRPANEPWRDHVAGGAFHDRWRNNNW
jgi:hypothetical protein